MNFKIFPALLIVVGLAATAAAQTKISGTAQCGKPNPSQGIELGDRAHHMFVLGQSKCTWTKPLEIAGTQMKESVLSGFDEIAGDKSQSQGFAVSTLANGDKTHARFVGSGTLKDGKPQTMKGQWRFVGGTGKVMGIKGQGTYKGTAGETGVTYEVEGEYVLPK